jgi:hypothetical protein
MKKNEAAAATPGAAAPAGGMSEDQAADFRALSAAALEPELELQEKEEGAEKAQEVALLDKNTQGLSMLLDLAAPTFDGFGFPRVAGVLKADGSKLVAAWAPVLTKYGVNLEQLAGAYKEEILAAVLTLPIALALGKALKEDARSHAPALEAAPVPAMSQVATMTKAGQPETLGTPEQPIAARPA